MRTWVIRWTTWRRRLLFVAVMSAIGVLFCAPQAAQNGVRHGLAVCAQLLVPSLFPFLVIAGFLVKGGFLQSLGRRAEPLMRWAFGFGGNAAGAILLSMIGGYPAGATAVVGLLQNGDIDRGSAKRLLRVTVHAGPAFVIGGIGVGMLHSVEAGLLLLGAHLLSSLIVMGIERRPSSPVPLTRQPPLSLGRAVTDSVHDATKALLSMCGFVLLASAALSLVDALSGDLSPHPWWRCLLSCVTEVSTGCLEACGMGAAAPFWIGATLGFGGLSVCGQIAAVTAGHGLLDRGFWRVRLLHALLGGTLSALFFSWFPPKKIAVDAVAIATSAFHEQHPSIAFTALLALMLLCVLFLQTLPSARRGE
ncbi:MAG: hypothetical protein IJB27_07265 [Clostridia bacterium]|nr:hypothetical protein [Clostridia bacterium]